MSKTWKLITVFLFALSLEVIESHLSESSELLRIVHRQLERPIRTDESRHLQILNCDIILDVLEDDGLPEASCICDQEDGVNVFDLYCSDFCERCSMNDPTFCIAASYNLTLELDEDLVGTFTKQAENIQYNGTRSDFVVSQDTYTIDGTFDSCSISVNSLECISCAASSSIDDTCHENNRIFDCTNVDGAGKYNECNGDFQSISEISPLVAYNRDEFTLDCLLSSPVASPVESPTGTDETETEMPTSGPSTDVPTISPTPGPTLFLPALNFVQKVEAALAMPNDSPSEGPTTGPIIHEAVILSNRESPTIPLQSVPEASEVEEESASSPDESTEIVPDDGLFELENFVLLLDADNLDLEQLSFAVADYLFEQVQMSEPSVAEILVAVAAISRISSRRQLFIKMGGNGYDRYENEEDDYVSPGTGMIPSMELIAVEMLSLGRFNDVPNLVLVNSEITSALQDTDSLNEFVQADDGIASRIKVVDVVSEITPEMIPATSPVTPPESYRGYPTATDGGFLSGRMKKKKKMKKSMGYMGRGFSMMRRMYYPMSPVYNSPIHYSYMSPMMYYPMSPAYFHPSAPVQYSSPIAPPPAAEYAWSSLWMRGMKKRKKRRKRMMMEGLPRRRRPSMGNEGIRTGGIW